MRAFGLLAFIGLALILGCSPGNGNGGGGGGGGGNGGGNNNPPGNGPAPFAVVSTAPSNSQLSVDLDASVAITFNQDIAAGTVNANTITFMTQGGPVAGDFTVMGAVVTFTPTVPLPGSSPVQGTVTTNVESVTGAQLGQAYVFTFGTVGVVQQIAESANMQQVKLAVSAGGLIMVMWVQNDPGGYRLFARSWEPQTGWAMATEIEVSGLQIWSLKLDCTENNEAVAAWSEGSSLPNSIYSVLTARFTAGQGWGPTETHTTLAINSPIRFTLDREGSGGLLWSEWSTRGNFSSTRLRFLDPDGTWQDEEEVLTAGVNDTITFGAAGDLYSVWYNSGNVGVTRYADADGWTSETLLGIGSPPKFGSTARPDGHVIYAIDDDVMEMLQFDGTDWNPIDVGAALDGNVWESDIASAPAGETYLSWIAESDGIRNVFGGFLDVDGTWTDVQVLEASDGYAATVSVACTDGGEGWTVFVQTDGASDSVYFSRYVPGTGWAMTIELDETDNGCYQPMVAAQGPGGCAVWQRNSGVGTWQLMARILE